MHLLWELDRDFSFPATWAKAIVQSSFIPYPWKHKKDPKEEKNKIIVLIMNAYKKIEIFHLRLRVGSIYIITQRQEQKHSYFLFAWKLQYQNLNSSYASYEYFKLWQMQTTYCRLILKVQINKPFSPTQTHKRPLPKLESCTGIIYKVLPEIQFLPQDKCKARES